MNKNAKSQYTQAMYIVTALSAADQSNFSLPVGNTWPGPGCDSESSGRPCLGTQMQVAAAEHRHSSH